MYVLFSYVGVCFDKLETEFIEIIHYWQIKETACLNERLFFAMLHFSIILSIKALIRIPLMEMTVQ